MPTARVNLHEVLSRLRGAYVDLAFVNGVAIEWQSGEHGTQEIRKDVERLLRLAMETAGRYGVDGEFQVTDVFAYQVAARLGGDIQAAAELVAKQALTTQEVRDAMIGSVVGTPHVEGVNLVGDVVINNPEPPNTPNTCLLYTSPSPRDS